VSKPVRKKLVEIVWVDPETDPGWHSEDHHRPMDSIYAYGLLVSQTEERVTLATGYDPSKQNWSDLMRFPRGCILKMTTILTLEFDE